MTAADRLRRALVALSGPPALGRALHRLGSELVRASDAAAAGRGRGLGPTGDVPYGESYFGVGRDPGGDRQGRSGYATYDRVSSNADIAAYLVWRNFRVARVLDVGCATGYLVEALHELGVDAYGCDMSQYAVEHAAPGARGRVRVGDPLKGLPYADHSFELVTALEVLEHLDPTQVLPALLELRRVCGGLVYATIPSFGPNPSGADGHLEGKVRPERLAHYAALGPGYDGPVPRHDLAVDADGLPIEGHLTIASYSWWTARFAEAGFERRLDVERRLYRDIEPAGLGPFWNLYVLAVPGASTALTAPLRPEATLRDLGLDHPLLSARDG